MRRQSKPSVCPTAQQNVLLSVTCQDLNNSQRMKEGRN